MEGLYLKSDYSIRHCSSRGHELLMMNINELSSLANNATGISVSPSIDACIDRVSALIIITVSS